MKQEEADSVQELRKLSKVFYLLLDEHVADDIKDRLEQVITEIERLREIEFMYNGLCK